MLDHLVARVAELGASSTGRVLIGIAGAPGAGKTTLAEALVARLGDRAAHVPMDGFHLADSELRRLGRADRKGAPDTFDPGGYAALLSRIAAGEEVWAPGFERALEQPIAQQLHVGPDVRIVVSEGNYLLLPDPFWRRVRVLFTEVWFVRTNEATRRDRLIARHVEFGKSLDAAREWVLRTDELNAASVAPTAADADLIVEVG